MVYNYKRRPRRVKRRVARSSAFKGKRLAISRVPRPVTYRDRSAYMKTQETYKFFIDPKVTTTGSGESAVLSQHPWMIDITMNSPYSFRSGYKSVGADMICNSEPSITEYTGSNGDGATVTPGLYETGDRPGGDRSAGYAGAKYTTAMVTGCKVTTNFTPVQAGDIKVQPGYLFHIRSSSNDFGGLTQNNADYTTLSKIPFVKWKRVRGSIVSKLTSTPTTVGGTDALSRSVSLTTNHSVAEWNNVTDLNDCKDRFSWQLNNPDQVEAPEERDHLVIGGIPELSAVTLGGASNSTQAPAGILTLTIRKTIKFSEPLSGKGDLDTANLPPVYPSAYKKGVTRNSRTLSARMRRR